MPSWNDPPFALIENRFVALSKLVASGELSRPRVVASWVVGLSILLLAIEQLRKAYSCRSLPPGPKGLPVVGNLFQLSGDTWITFTKWRDIYGPLVHLNVPGQHIVVLNDHKVTADLLDRRAGNYSDRPRYIVASEIMTGGLFIVFSRYGDVYGQSVDLRVIAHMNSFHRWRRLRRAAHKGLNRTITPIYRPLQLKEAVHLVDGLLNNQDAWDKEVKRAAASMIMSVVYDTPVIELCDDPSIERVNGFAGCWNWYTGGRVAQMTAQK